METPYVVNYRLSISPTGSVLVNTCVGDRVIGLESFPAMSGSEAVGVIEGVNLCQFCSARLMQTEIDVWGRTCVVCVVKGKDHE